MLIEIDVPTEILKSCPARAGIVGHAVNHCQYVIDGRCAGAGASHLKDSVGTPLACPHFLFLNAKGVRS